jgi:hypothetical protein
MKIVTLTLTEQEFAVIDAALGGMHRCWRRLQGVWRRDKDPGRQPGDHLGGPLQQIRNGSCQQLHEFHDISRLVAGKRLAAQIAPQRCAQ